MDNKNRPDTAKASTCKIYAETESSGAHRNASTEQRRMRGKSLGWFSTLPSFSPPRKPLLPPFFIKFMRNKTKAPLPSLCVLFASFFHELCRFGDCERERKKGSNDETFWYLRGLSWSWEGGLWRNKYFIFLLGSLFCRCRLVAKRQRRRWWRAGNFNEPSHDTGAGFFSALMVLRHKHKLGIMLLEEEGNSSSDNF